MTPADARGARNLLRLSCASAWLLLFGLTLVAYPAVDLLVTGTPTVIGLKVFIVGVTTALFAVAAPALMLLVIINTGVRHQLLQEVKREPNVEG